MTLYTAQTPNDEGTPLCLQGIVNAASALGSTGLQQQKDLELATTRNVTIHFHQAKALKTWQPHFPDSTAELKWNMQLYVATLETLQGPSVRNVVYHKQYLKGEFEQVLDYLDAMKADALCLAKVMCWFVREQNSFWELWDQTRGRYVSHPPYDGQTGLFSILVCHGFQSPELLLPQQFVVQQNTVVPRSMGTNTTDSSTRTRHCIPADKGSAGSSITDATGTGGSGGGTPPTHPPSST
jgi:hypothetical protein